MKQFLTIVFILLGVSLWGQTISVWQDISEQQMVLDARSEVELPVEEYRTVTFDVHALRQSLRTVPTEKELDISQSSFTINVPMPNGGTAEYRFVEASVMAPGLQARYPDIRAYRAVSTSDARFSGRFDISPYGFNGVFESAEGEFFIDPYATNQGEYYSVYYTHDVVISEDNHTQLSCGFVAEEHMDESPLEGMAPANMYFGARSGNPLPVRVYDLALTCTGEYAEIHGNSVSGVMASFNTALNRLNQIFENEVAIRVQLIENNDQLIYLDKNTDPFINASDGTGLLSQVLLAIVETGGIPFSFFDIGHVFTRGCTDVGGVVSGQACTAGKTEGVTCHSSTNINAIVRRIMSHEIAHQFAVAHSWSNCEDSDPNDGEDILAQLASGSAYEPGSGTTIMSYAGTCGNQNVQFGPDDYYSVGSLEEFTRYSRIGNASGCATLLDIGNTEPDINWTYEDNFYIPMETPFELSTTATDMEGDSLTYCWEQFDLGPLSPLGSPIQNAPAFRSYYPRPENNRVFPRWDVIVNNQSSVVEVLPTVSRDLTFRCTVRDNHPGGGAAVWETVEFFATDQAGPFLVESPNLGNEVMEVGEYVEVRWDVANTDQAPVNCQSVNIRLSVDGGYTYPITLVSNAPNIGIAGVTIPDAVTNEARIRVEAADNVFFDISNFDFRILPASEPRFTLGSEVLFEQICLPNTTAITYNSGSILGYDTEINLDVITSLPGTISASFDNPTIQPGASSVLNFDFAADAPAGPIEVEVRAISGLDTTFRTLNFVLIDNDFSALNLLGPPDGESGIVLSTEFSWNDIPNALTYNFELATSPAFGSTVVESASGLEATTYLPENLIADNQYLYWRIQPVNECGPGPWLEPFSFHTLTTTCAPNSPEDTPVFIPGSGPLPTRESVINVPFSGTISDLNLQDVEIIYTPIRNIRVSLISPAGTEVYIFDENCGGTNKIDLGFDDEAPSELVCAPDIGIVVQPVNPLSTFDGENTQGDWTLRVEVVETGFGDPGSIENWSMEFCATGTPSPPILINNNALAVPPAGTNPILRDQLLAEDPDQGPDELTFTLVTPPAHGTLLFAGGAISVGDQFRQVSIDNFNVEYQHSGDGSEEDQFTFTVVDGTGGFIPNQTFVINIDPNAPVSTREENQSLAFSIAPNPTSDWTLLSLPDVVNEPSPIRIMTMDGRLVYNQVIPAGNQEWQINTNNMVSGVYLVQVISAGRIGTKRLVVH